MSNVDINATIMKMEQIKREFEQWKEKNGTSSNGSTTSAKTPKTKTKKTISMLPQSPQPIVRKRVPMELVINNNGTCNIMNVPYDAKGRLSGTGTSLVHYSTGRPQVVDEKHHIQLSIIEYANKW